MADITIAPVLDATLASTAHIIYTDAATGTTKKAPISALPLSDAEIAALAGKASTSHQHNASDLTAGTLDGDRLPALSTTKKGGVPATGAVPSSTKFLAETGSWLTPAGGGGGSLPDQTGETGKVLSTDGTDPLWVSTKKYFNVVDYGADPNSDSDDSAAILAALADCAANGGGTIYFPLPRNSSGYHYYVDSPLITSIDGINPNAQIVIPLFISTGHMPTIVFEGEVAPSFNTEGILSYPRNNIGCIIESRILGTGTLPSVFGTSYYASGIWGNRNFVKLMMKNLIVRTRTMTSGVDILGTMSAINFGNMVNFLADQVKVDISSSLANSVDLTPALTCGMIFPTVNNKVDLTCGSISAEGYTRGIVTGEHFNANHVQVYGCYYGLSLTSAYHAASIKHFTAEVNKNNIELNGSTNLSIQQYESEQYNGPEWYAHDYELYRQAGTSKIRIFNSNVVVSSVGSVTDNSYWHTFGDPDYKILFGCGQNVLDIATGELPQYTDLELLDLVTTTPFTYHNTTVNEMQYFDGTDFFSLDKTPYTPSAPASLSDDFNRADSTVSLGNTVTPGTAWPAPINGTWGISSNQAYCVSESSLSGLYIQGFDVGVADFELQATITRNTVAASCGLAFRIIDSGNHFFVELSNATTGLYKKVGGGSYVSIGTDSTVNPTATPIVIKVVTSGTSINVYRNGSLIITVTESALLTATIIGMIVDSAGTGTTCTWDDLTATV